MMQDRVYQMPVEDVADLRDWRSLQSIVDGAIDE